MNNVYVHCKKKKKSFEHSHCFVSSKKRCCFFLIFFFFFLFLLQSNLLVSQANGYETNQCNPLEWKARQVHKELVHEKRAKYYANSENAGKKNAVRFALFSVKTYFYHNLHERPGSTQNLFRFQFRFPSLDIRRPFLPNFAANRRCLIFLITVVKFSLVS